MHARFNFDPCGEEWEEYFKEGQLIHERNKHLVEDDLGKFADAEGILKADEIIENWFPKINSDVFLSHSHKDEKLVVGLAGWLKREFNVISFIDSAVWGYSDALLKKIDDAHCKINKGQNYSYEMRNRSTSHVHMMLSSALSDMMDRCECIIFANTPNSFRPIDYFEDEGSTESPWIYSEIAMTRIIRQRSPSEHRPESEFVKSSGAAMESLREARELRISYPMDLLHLTPLNASDLRNWLEKWNANKENGARGLCALDYLYELKRG